MKCLSQWVNLNYISFIPHVLPPCLLLKADWSRRSGVPPMYFQNEARGCDRWNQGCTIEIHPVSTHSTEKNINKNKKQQQRNPKQTNSRHKNMGPCYLESLGRVSRQTQGIHKHSRLCHATLTCSAPWLWVVVTAPGMFTTERGRPEMVPVVTQSLVVLRGFSSPPSRAAHDIAPGLPMTTNVRSGHKRGKDLVLLRMEYYTSCLPGVI